MPLLFILAFLSAPLYVWRFDLSNQPVNALMIILSVIILIAAVHIVSNGWLQEFWAKARTPKAVWWLAELVLLASVISLFVGGADGPKLAQWLVLYIQPLLMYLLIRFYAIKYPSLRGSFALAVYVMLGVIGILALVQFFTLWSLPPDYWGNSTEPKRAIGFFAHPNAFGLFITPLLAWLLPDVVQRFTSAWRHRHPKDILLTMLWLLGVAGMFLSLSRGAWFGFVAACILFAILSANKKIMLALVGIGVIVAGLIAVTPNLRYRLLLPFYGEKSAVARLSLWNTAGNMIKDAPILGKGIHGFNYNWDKYNQDKNLDHYNFPHNIFLNFWVDLGLLGLLSMTGLIIYALLHAVLNRRSQYHLAMGLFVAALVVHGLIDIPYLKNDLALVFWMVLALSI